MTNVLVVVTLLTILPGNYSCGVEWAGAPLQVTHSLLVLQPPAITKPAEGQYQHHHGVSSQLCDCTRPECARQPGRVSAADLPGLGGPPAQHLVEQGAGA